MWKSRELARLFLLGRPEKPYTTKPRTTTQQAKNKATPPPIQEIHANTKSQLQLKISIYNERILLTYNICKFRAPGTEFAMF